MVRILTDVRIFDHFQQKIFLRVLLFNNTLYSLPQNMTLFQRYYST